MKKFLIGTMILGLASLGYSQGSDTAIEEVKLSDVTVTPINAEYMNEVHGGTGSIRVYTLEREASRFNLKESPFFNEGGLSKVQFSQKNGRISATYSFDGKILSANEKYKNLILPKAVRNAVYEQYSDWDIDSTVYLVNYNSKRGAKKVYKITVKKGPHKMNLKYDVEGNRI